MVGSPGLTTPTIKGAERHLFLFSILKFSVGQRIPAADGMVGSPGLTTPTIKGAERHLFLFSILKFSVGQRIPAADGMVGSPGLTTPTIKGAERHLFLFSILKFSVGQRIPAADGMVGSSSLTTPTIKGAERHLILSLDFCCHTIERPDADLSGKFGIKYLNLGQVAKKNRTMSGFFLLSMILDAGVFTCGPAFREFYQLLCDGSSFGRPQSCEIVQRQNQFARF